MEISADFYILTLNKSDLSKTVNLIDEDEEHGDQLKYTTVRTAKFIDENKVEQNVYWAKDNIVLTSDPSYSFDSTWESTLDDCSELLGNDGIVVLRYWSPDHPDDYCSYGYTIPQGSSFGEGVLPGNFLDSYDFCLSLRDCISKTMTKAFDRDWLQSFKQRERKVQKGEIIPGEDDDSYEF